jgi:hypothetical protein
MHKNNRFTVVFVALVLFLHSCSSNKPPKCSIETLLLDENFFPQGTYAEQLFSPVPEYPSESAGRTHYYPSDSVLQIVVNWHSKKYAKNEFDFQSKSAFDVDQFMGPWEIPDGIYASTIAQNYHAACGVASHIYQCRMISTYDGYSVFFRAEVSEQGITLQKVNELLQAIDERMTQCVD